MAGFDDLEYPAGVFKALSHAVRLYIMERLSEKDYCVQELTALIGYDISTVSKHLSILKSAGLICSRREGNCIYYSLKATCVTGFVSCIRSMNEKNAGLNDSCMCQTCDSED